MHHDGTSVWGVAGFHPSQEGQERGGVLGHAVVRPRRELELPHLALLTGAVLQDKGPPASGGHQHPKAACAVCAAWATAHLQGKQEQEPAHLVKGERSDAERGQFNGVQQRHLDHSVGVRASAWPVLVTLYLQDRRDGSVLGQTLQWWEAHSQTALLQVKLGRWQRQGEVQEVSLQSTRTGTDPSEKAPTD